MAKPILHIYKIGGSILDSKEAWQKFLLHFQGREEAAIIVHGGGKVASSLLEELGIPVKMVEGRRITDAETLRVVTMAYAGLLNKQVVADLKAVGRRAIGLTGADGDCIRAVKRPVKDIDYGFVGDIESVNSALLTQMIREGYLPALAPLTHDGNGQLLNTNADTIAAAVAVALTANFDVRLYYILDLPGVLQDIGDPESLIRELDLSDLNSLQTSGTVSAGMIPKLSNAKDALSKGVSNVVLTDVEHLAEAQRGNAGSQLTLKDRS